MTEMDDVYRRLNISLATLLIGGMVTLVSFHQWRMSLGFLIGAIIALVNLRILKRTVISVGEMIGEGKATPSARKQALKFVLRYGLLGAALYVIVKGSTINAYGVFIGLFLPVGAILIEAVYELYLALWRGA
ncbi:MAG TPA: ATP synthase subunit I [Terriglobales bacterium]